MRWQGTGGRAAKVKLAKEETKLTAPRFYENPILTKELRTRMRGARPFWVLFVYIGILSLILFATYASWWRTASSGGMTGGAYRVGREFYYTLFVVKALLVAAITPALTAGGVSIEKEQRTFDLLTISLLPRTAVVLGKLFSALAFIALLMTASLPLVCIGFLLGGVSPDEVAVSYGELLLTSFVYGAIGIACSAMAKNTTTATVMTYGVILGLFFTTLPLAMMGINGVVPGAANQNLGGLKAINPIGAVIAGTQKETYFGMVVPAWASALLLNGMLGVICTVVALHRLDWPRSDRSGLLRLLVAVFTGCLAFALYGILLPGETPGWTSSVEVGLVITLLGLSVLVPLFATADGLPKVRVALSLLDPRRLARGEAPSGVLYLLLLTLLCGGLLYAGQRWGVSSPSVLPPVIPHSGVKLASGNTIQNQHLADILQGTGVIVATIWVTGTLGLLLTTLLKNRVGAMFALAGLMLVTYLVPYAYISSQDGSSRSEKINPMERLLLVSPLVATSAVTQSGLNFLGEHLGHTVTTTQGKKELLAEAKRAPFFFQPIYVQADVLYATGGFVFLFAALVVERRGRKGQSKEAP